MPAAVELVGINKRFGAVLANRDVSLRVAGGSVHGVVGENGAGKSTLMSILYGYYQADSGQIRINGETAKIRDPAAAIARGIGMVHQHFMLVENFTVLENVTLGAEGGALLARGVAAARTALADLERDYALQVDMDAVVEELPVGARQRVEILKALYRGAEVLILDEPTGVLTPREAEHLFRILKELKSRGQTVIFITHKLREVMAITDEVTVMRQGRVVAHRNTAETRVEELAELMVGRQIRHPQRETQGATTDAPVLDIRDLRVASASGCGVNGVSFAVHAGEVVGIAGVSGNGQSELLESMAGMRRPDAGEIRLNGRPLPGADGAHAARGLGLAHVPEDRSRMGLVMEFPAYESAVLGYQDDPRYAHAGLLEPGAMRADTARKMQAYDARPVDPDLITANFSGGNQQKIVLAREFERDPQVLLIGQPTRGVDIGAIEFIHQRILDMRARGKAIVLVSVELDEILALSDRIMVMFGGRIVGELDAASADERQLGMMMAGAGGVH